MERTLAAMVTASARVRGAVGSKVPPDLPVRMPSSTAFCTSAAYQAAGSTSGKAVYSATFWKLDMP